MDIHVPQYYIQAVKFLKEVEVTLREHCSVRVHWGKEFFGPAKDVLAAWPKEAIEQFVNIRQTCDPGGMFSNAYVRRLLDTCTGPGFLDKWATQSRRLLPERLPDGGLAGLERRQEALLEKNE